MKLGKLVKSLILQLLEIPGLRRKRTEDRKVSGSKRRVVRGIGMWEWTLFVGSLGVRPKQFGNRLKSTVITAEIGQVKKTVVLRTARI